VRPGDLSGKHKKREKDQTISAAEEKKKKEAGRTKHSLPGNPLTSQRFFRQKKGRRKADLTTSLLLQEKRGRGSEASTLRSRKRGRKQEGNVGAGSDGDRFGRGKRGERKFTH